MKNQSHGGVVGWFIVALIALLIALLVVFGRAGAASITSTSQQTPTGAAKAPYFTPSPLPTSTPTITPACGVAWRRTDLASAQYGTFRAVQGLSVDDVWAVGYQGLPGQTLIEHWDGAEWNIVPSPNAPSGANFLTALDIVSPNDIWAVGYSGTFSSAGQTLILHWDGIQWTIVPSPNADPEANVLTAVTSVSPDDIWAVGYSGNGGQFGGTYDTLILHWNGAVWSIAPSPNPGVYQNLLLDVEVLGPDNVWAVGSWSDAYGQGYFPLVLRWDGNQWQRTTEPNASQWGELTGLEALAPDNVWAMTSSQVFNWDGSAWSNVPAPPNVDRLGGIAALAPNDIWFVGYNSSVIHWDGVALNSVNTLSGQHLNDAAAVADEVWAVGFGDATGPSALHYNDPCATPSPTSTPTMTVTGTLPTATPTFTPTSVPTCNPWSIKAPLPRGAMGSSAAVSGGYLYSMGGRDFNYTNTALTSRYDPLTDTWTALAEMPAVRNWASAAAANGYIYVVNGSDGAGALDTVFRYDIAANTWTTLPPTIGSTYGPAVVALNGDIYRIGGLDQNGVFTSSVELLGQGYVAPLPIGRAWLSAVVIDGYIYAAGGAGAPGEGNYSGKAFRYDPATDTWSDEAIADLPEPKAYSAAGVVNGQFVIAGGGNSYESVWSWSPQTNTWTRLPDMPIPRFNMPGASLNNVLHVLGGINDTVPTDDHQQYDPSVCSSPSPSPTSTATSTASPTPLCSIEFTDVPQDHTFYAYVHCLACWGIVSGYPCGGPGEPCDPQQNPYFRPQVNVTRGQIAKIVAAAAAWADPVTGQAFEDVPPGSTFYEPIGRMASRNIISGYPCGSPEPCIPPANRPYFRPNDTSTRGQLTKIVSSSAGYTDPPIGQTFEDVLPASTFYTFTQRLTSREIMAGYPCGNPEPCVPPQNRPYFRPANPVTRGQTTKLVANTFFPDCNIPGWW